MLLFGAGGIIVLFLAALIVLGPHRGAVDIDLLENQVKVALINASRSTVEEADGALARLQRHLSRQRARAARCIQTDASEAHLEAEYYDRLSLVLNETDALRERVDAWRCQLRETPVGKAREDAWTDIIVGILKERGRWPLAYNTTNPPPQFRPFRILREFRQGIEIGALWPLHTVQRMIQQCPASYGFFRRMIFPYGGNAGFRWTHIVGIGFASVVMGYGLCWLGMRHNRAFASYLGLFYFIHMIVFGVGLLCLRFELLS